MECLISFVSANIARDAHGEETRGAPNKKMLGCTCKMLVETCGGLMEVVSMEVAAVKGKAKRT